LKSFARTMAPVSVLVCHAHNPIILRKGAGWQDSVTWLSGGGHVESCRELHSKLVNKFSELAGGKGNWMRTEPMPPTYVKWLENMH